MQSNCPPNQIQMSENTALQLMEINEYKLTKRGIVHVKGKGDVNTYWLNEHIHEPHDNIGTHTGHTSHHRPPVTPAKKGGDKNNNNNNKKAISRPQTQTPQPSIIATSFSPINSEHEPLIG